MPPLRVDTSNAGVLHYTQLTPASGVFASTPRTASTSTACGSAPGTSCHSSFEGLPPSSPINELPIASSPLLGAVTQEEHLFEGDDFEDINDETLVEIDLPSTPDSSTRKARFKNPSTSRSPYSGHRKGQIIYADSSDPGIIATSPAVGAKLRRKAAQKGAATRRRNQATQKALEQAEKQRVFQRMDKILDKLRAEGITFGALFKYALDTRPKGWLWQNIFKFNGLADSILDSLLSSRNSKTGQDIMREWAVKTTCRTIYREGERTTKSGMLRVRAGDINAELVRNFDYEKLFLGIRKCCPTTIQVFRAFATTNRQHKNMTEAKEAKKLLVRRVVQQFSAQLTQEM